MKTRNLKQGDKVRCISPFISLSALGNTDYGQVGRVYEVETYNPETDEMTLVELEPVMFSRRFELVE